MTLRCVSAGDSDSLLEERSDIFGTDVEVERTTMRQEDIQRSPGKETQEEVAVTEDAYGNIRRLVGSTR
jgi:hypothetical protein